MAAFPLALVKTVIGNLRMVTGEFELDDSYPEDGYPATALEMSDGYISEAYHVIVSPAYGYTFEWDNGNSKVIVRAPGGAGAHTHTIAVANGSAGTAMTLDDATGINVNDGTDAVAITTSSSVASVGAASQAATGADLSTLRHVPYMIIGV